MVFTLTDNGHLILSRYIDIAPDMASKRAVRPPVLVKAIEQRYALEFSPTIQVSSPHRFRQFGESFIQDDQEGHAKDEYVTGSETSHPERDLELQEAVDLLAPDADISISDTKTNSSNSASRSLTFGKAAWIYCTSIQPTAGQVDRWREHLSESYDHVSVIRQPITVCVCSGFGLRRSTRCSRADRRLRSRFLRRSRAVLPFLSDDYARTCLVHGRCTRFPQYPYEGRPLVQSSIIYLLSTPTIRTSLSTGSCSIASFP